MASLGISGEDLIRTLFGSKAALLPAVNRQASKAQMRLMAQQAAAANMPTIMAGMNPNNEANSGSSNRVGFGLSDFGLQPGPTPAPAPKIAGQAKHVSSGPNLRQAAINAIMSQYAPVLGQYDVNEGMLRKQAAADRADATKRGNLAAGDAAVLYSRLRQYAGNTQRAQDQDYRVGVKTTRKNFNALAGQIRNDLNASGGGVAADLKRLGVDPSIALAGAARDAAFQRSMVREDRANQVTNQRSSRREYDAGMGRMKNDIIATGNAAVGTQKSQTNAAINDIARQLTSNLMQVEMAKAQTLGSRAGALAQLKLSQLQAAAKGKDPMAHLNMLYKQAQIAKMLRDANNPAGSSSADKGPGKGMADALAYLNSVYPTTNANWSTQKRTQISKLLEDLQAQGSKTNSGLKNGAYWDPKQYGDLLSALFGNMGGVKGGKGGALYGGSDKQAAQNALMIALGLM